mmetsp:Transcript_13876/g.26131  ORF Transcript_13876/g.26131 Transcript_13876/m.26131 type:complete len:506 (+) Transcript_13876:125-1642(+)
MTTPPEIGNGNAGGVPLFYEPPPNELNYYHELFSLADQNKNGEIQGQAAVSFLSRSKLPVDLLRNIWAMVDHPKTNSLNRSKFFAAVRLIQLFQNGQKVSGPGLQSVGGNVVVMRPPFFEGVTGVSATPFEIVPAGIGTGATGGVASGTSASGTSGGVAAPVLSIPSPSSPRRDSQLSYATTSSMLLQGQGYPITTSSTTATSPTSGEANTALTHDPYLMLPGEKIRYESLFPQYAQEDEFVYGSQAVELFTKSGLSKDALRDIWNLVDNPVDNRLDILEFAIAMHLIVCVSKKNLPLPKTLPFSLKALKNREAASVQQKHQQQQQQQQSPNPTTSTAAAAAASVASPFYYKAFHRRKNMDIMLGRTTPASMRKHTHSNHDNILCAESKIQSMNLVTSILLEKYKAQVQLAIKERQPYMPLLSSVKKQISFIARRLEEMNGNVSKVCDLQQMTEEQVRKLLADANVQKGQEKKKEGDDEEDRNNGSSTTTTTTTTARAANPEIQE